MSSRISETDYTLLEAALDCLTKRETNQAVILTTDNHIRYIWKYYLDTVLRSRRADLNHRLEIRMRPPELEDLAKKLTSRSIIEN